MADKNTTWPSIFDRRSSIPVRARPRPSISRAVAEIDPLDPVGEDVAQPSISAKTDAPSPAQASIVAVTAERLADSTVPETLSPRVRVRPNQTGKPPAQMDEHISSSAPNIDKAADAIDQSALQPGPATSKTNDQRSNRGESKIERPEKRKSRQAGPDYDVGYGRPPIASRFQPGQSGNPKGRGKGNLNAKTLIEQTLNKKPSIRIDGKPQTKTTREVIVMSIAQKAMKGDHRAAQALMPDLVVGGGRGSITRSEEAAMEAKPVSLSSAEKMMLAIAKKDRLLEDGFKEEDSEHFLDMIGLLEHLPIDRRQKKEGGDVD